LGFNFFISDFFFFFFLVVYGSTPLARHRYWYTPYETAAIRTSTAYMPIPVPVESVEVLVLVEVAGALGAGSPGWKETELERKGTRFSEEREEEREGTTNRLMVPMSRPSRISRASSLWPTSSKASVASWPATSSRTSSPPLRERTVS
jgi:hypothetical protein